MIRRASIVVLALALPALAAAQGSQSTISGIIRDASGAAIPGASVRVVNERTGVAVEAVTDEQRSYVASLPVAGDFRIEVALDGFQPATARATFSDAAQTPQPQPVTGFQDGFFIQTPDGDNRLLLGVLVQADGRFSLDDPTPTTNTFTTRRIRPTVSGRLARFFEFKLTPEFAGGNVTALDAYFDIRFTPALRLRAGKDKTPIGYELLIGDAFLPFPDRSVVSGLVPSRDVGFQAQGDITSWLSFAGGVFNGVPDGSSTTSDVDTNNGKDVAGRLTVRAPFGLGLHLGASTGEQEGALPSFRAASGQTYFSYAAGVAAAGRRTRVTPAFSWFVKSLGVFGELARSRQEVRRADDLRTFTNRAWNLTAMYNLTGEPAGVSHVRPRLPFNPPQGHWGALQIAARVAAITFDDAAIITGFAASGAARKATQLTIGVNWFATPYVKSYLTFERTNFKDGVPPFRQDEHVIQLRLQLAI